MSKISAWIFGVIFLIAGVWGLISGSFLGIFAADVLSSIIHIVAGLVLIYVAVKALDKGPVTLKTVGIIYVVFAILGFAQGSSVLFGYFVTNSATNWLYLVLGIVIAVLGFADKGSSSSPAPQM